MEWVRVYGSRPRHIVQTDANVGDVLNRVVCAAQRAEHPVSHRASVGGGPRTPPQQVARSSMAAPLPEYPRHIRYVERMRAVVTRQVWAARSDIKVSAERRRTIDGGFPGLTACAPTGASFARLDRLAQLRRALLVSGRPQPPGCTSANGALTLHLSCPISCPTALERMI